MAKQQVIARPSSNQTARAAKRVFFRPPSRDVPAPPPGPGAAPRFVGGMNLANHDPFGPLLFNNAFRGNDLFVVVDDVTFGANSGTIARTADGYASVDLPHDGGDGLAVLQTTMLAFSAGTYPAGDWTLKFLSGAGAIVTLSGDVSGTYENVAGGEFSQTVSVTTPTAAGITLRIVEQAGADPVRDVRFLRPGTAATYLTQPINPDIVAKLQLINGPIRAMNLTRTNQHAVTTWAGRTSPTFYCQAVGTGVAWEHVIALCNAANRDLWLNIPAKVLGDLAAADLTYVNNLFTLIRDTLSAGLKVWIEYSNEIAWNGSFSQTGYANTTGAAIGFQGTTAQQGRKFVALRSAQSFVAAESILGAARIRKVIGGHAANAAVGEEVLGYLAMESIDNVVLNPTGVRATDLAIAPYIGNGLADAIVANGELSTISNAEILRRLEFDYLPISIGWIAGNRAVATAHGLELSAYEGGLFLLGTGANTSNSTLTALLLTANRDVQCYRIYRLFLDAWIAAGGGVFCHYHLCDGFTGGTMFGAMEHLDQPLTEAQKWRAFIEHCAATIAFDGVMPMFAARRASGVGPLLSVVDIFNDPRLTKPPPNGSGDPDPAIWHWSHHYGKVGAGVYAATGKSKNWGTGVVAATMLETAGDFVWETTCIRDDGSVLRYKQTIHVDDPLVVFAALKRYVDEALGDDSYDGTSLTFTSGTTGPWKTATKALSATGLFAIPSGMLLVKRDRTYAMTSSSTISGKAGPYWIGTYGDGADPVIDTSANIFALSLGTDTHDVRVIDLNFVGDPAATSNGAIAPGTDCVFLRCTIADFPDGLVTSDVAGSRNGSGLVECTIGSGVSDHCVYWAMGYQCALLGNFFSLDPAVSNENMVRIYLSHSVVNNNDFSGGSTGKHHWRLAGFYPSTGLTNGTFTSNADGWLEDNTGAVGTAWVWESPGRVRHIPGNTTPLTAPIANMAVGDKRGVNFSVGFPGTPAGSVTPNMGTGAGTARSAAGNFSEAIVCATNNLLRFVPSSDFDGWVDFDPANFTARYAMDTYRAGGEPTEAIEYTIFSDNISRSPAAGMTLQVMMGVTNSGDTMKHQNCIIERCRFENGSGIQRIIELDGTAYDTVRNCVLILTNRLSGHAIQVHRSGASSQLPVGNRIMNNTLYCGGAYTGGGIRFLTGATDSIASGNWLVKTSGAGTVITQVGDTNTTLADNTATNTGMVDPPTDCRPSSLTAVAASSYIRDDFNGFERHATTPSRGALEPNSVMV